MGDFNDQEYKSDNQKPQQNNPDLNQQPQYQQPQNQQQQYQQPQNQQPQYQQPQYQQPQYQQTQYQQPLQPGYQYQQNQDTEPRKSNGMAVAALVLGIVSFVLSCVYYISIPAAIVGLILGIISIKGNKGRKGMAIAGIILSGIGLLFALVIVFGIVALFQNENFMNGLSEDLFDSLDQYK